MKISSNLLTKKMVIFWATRCAQVTQLLASDWDVHKVDNPLVVMQLDTINAFCSIRRQAQSDVLAVMASTS